MIGIIKWKTVVLMTFCFVNEALTSKHLLRQLDDLKKVVDNSIAHIVANNENKRYYLPKPEKPEEIHFGSLADKNIQDLLDEKDIQNKQHGDISEYKDYDNFMQQLNVIFAKQKKTLSEIKKTSKDSDERVANYGKLSGDIKSYQETDGYHSELEFLKELNLYSSPAFQDYIKTEENDVKNYLKDPSNEKGDSQNDAYWVDKENPENYIQQGPSVLEQLLKEQKRHERVGNKNKKKTYLKPNDLTGYSGLFDQEYGNIQNRGQETDDYISNDLNTKSHKVNNNVRDGVNLNKYSRIYVILNPQALKRSKTKSNSYPMVSDVLSSLQQNKQFLLNPNNRRRALRSTIRESTDEDESNEKSNEASEYYIPKPKLDNREKPLSAGNGGFSVGSRGGSRTKGRDGQKSRGAFIAKRFDSSETGSSKLGVRSIRKIKSPKSRVGNSRSDGGAGRTSIPYIGRSNIYEKDEYE